MPVDFPGSENVRPDLWKKIATIKNATNYSCGQSPLAESEVQLIWAGHEKVESGWSHAEAYARLVESSIAEAQTAINACNGIAPIVIAPAAPVIAVVAPTPSPVAPINVIEKITLTADALFDLDKASLTRYSKTRLDKLVRDIQNVKSVDEVILVGHTDRLRTDKKFQRNQILSEKRAQRIRQYLIGKGLQANIINARGVGSKEPVVMCSKKMSKAKLIACLQPNRRVEITLRGVQ
jgi:outer membrane protein OmpA-like peptidoglycan-associated protein